MIFLNTFGTNTIFRRAAKMGHKDVGLWLWNHIQKWEAKCCFRCTLKKGWGCGSIALCHFYYPTRLDNRSTKGMEEWRRSIGTQTKVAARSQYIRYIYLEKWFLMVQKILLELHTSPLGGHLGIFKNLPEGEEMIFLGWP